MFGRAFHSFDGARRYAVYSQDAKRRLLLEIDLVPMYAGTPGRDRARCVVFVMCNPSTATEEKNDPTVAKITKFARRWRYELLLVCNVFDWRDTDPKAMKRAVEPNGPANDAAILSACARADLVVLACGRNGEHRGRLDEVREMMRAHGIHPHWLRDPRPAVERGLAVDEPPTPVHPLYRHDGCVPELLP